MSSLLPIFLNLKGLPVLLVGGGDVALEKLVKLVSAGAQVTLIAPQIKQATAEFAAKHALQVLRRQFDADDVHGVKLVVSAVNCRETHRLIVESAHAAKVLVNSVDEPNLCDFFFAAQIDRGPLQIAISSQGMFPGVSKAIRQWLEDLFPTEISQDLSELAVLRLKTRQLFPHPIERMKRLKDQLTHWQRDLLENSITAERSLS